MDPPTIQRLPLMVDHKSTDAKPAGQNGWRSAAHGYLSRNKEEKKNVHNLGLDKSRKWMGYLVAPITAIAVLIAALVFGAKSQVILIRETTVLGIDVDQDLQIAFLGLFNKIIDMLVQYSLEKMALLYVTIWMIKPGVGATMQDVEELKNELVRPWTAVYNWWKRRRSGFWRLLLCVTVSTCVILLGLGINTLGWPKKRWYPNGPSTWCQTSKSRGDLTINVPLTTLERYDWSQDMYDGLDLVGGIPHLDDAGAAIMTSGAADELAGAISASSILRAITQLPSTYSNQRRDWYPVYEDVNILTCLQTAGDGAATQSLSIQTDRIMDIFKGQKMSGHSFAQGAVGFTGLIQLTVPLLTTICSSPKQSNSSANIPENSLEISPPAINSSTFTIDFGPSAGLSFPGASCAITLSQVIFPVQTWIVDMAAHPSAQVDNISATPVALPLGAAAELSSSNAAMASLLARHSAAILPMLHGIVPANGIVPHLILASRTLQKRNSNLTSDLAGLGPVIATLAQHQISAARWSLQTDNNTLIDSYPVQWQIYASGPRLEWEWAAATILVCIIIALVQSVWLVLTNRITIGRFLTLGGFLRMANATEELEAVQRTRSVKGGKKTKETAEDEMDTRVRFAVRAADGKEELPILVELYNGSGVGLPQRSDP